MRTQAGCVLKEAGLLIEPQVHTTSRIGTRFAGPMMIFLAALVILARIVMSSRYGFHRDELQFLADSRHLDWGFVIYPPAVPLLGRLVLSVFGLSLVAVRLLTLLAQTVCIVLTAMMTREFGGSKLAQIAAALVLALSPVPLVHGIGFTYTSFDYLWWFLAAYLLVLLVKSGNPRWWVPVGLVLGIGLETKYTILFFICGILAGIVFTPIRSHLRSGWFWVGIILAVLLVLPNALWQIRHQFISVHSLHAIHVRDLALGRDKGYIVGQFLANLNIFAMPIWIVGLIAFLRNKDTRYRLFAFAYLVPLALFALARARYYYPATAYPMLLAMGVVTSERWLSSISQRRQKVVVSTIFAGLTVYGIAACALIFPWPTSGKPLNTLIAHNDWLRDEIGWDSLVGKLSQVRNNLPEAQRANVGIVAGNYGEAGAIENLGQPLGLPLPISGSNSWWLRSYPQSPPTTLIVTGYTKQAAEGYFTNCRLADRQSNVYGIQTLETEDKGGIYVCGPPRLPWPEAWKSLQAFQ